MKIVWLSDIHLKPRGELLFGVDTVKRLQRAVTYIGQHHGDADCCMISGDLVDQAGAECYRNIRKIMASLPMPLLTVPGNHDDRHLMRQCFTYPDTIQDHFIQYSLTKQGCRLIALDTLHDGQAEGILCRRRLDWLKFELDNDRETPTMVFCHHHPARLQLPMQDKESLINGDVLLDMLCGAGNIRHLFFGHVHRPVSGSFGVLGFTSLQSVSLQAPLPYPSWNWGSFSPARESPALGIILATQNSVVTHIHPFCSFEDDRYPDATSTADG